MITITESRADGGDLSLDDGYEAFKAKLSKGGPVNLKGIAHDNPHPGVQMLKMWGNPIKVTTKESQADADTPRRKV